MLIVIFGVSCVGKSTIIEKLTTSGCIPVRVYTTRPLRDGETVKIHISDELFDQYCHQHKFSWVNQFFNTKYGTSQEDIIKALTHHDIYLLDYALAHSSDFNEINCLKVILLPENIESLIKQIKSANRHERLNEILLDYQTNYINSTLSQYVKQGYKLVKNYYSDPQIAVDQINSFIRSGGCSWQF